ncbi:rhomboid family intramembrane serine protease [bacterium]|nr:MAG: rhomboid family intramembrane serine protease [bacterium]
MDEPKNGGYPGEAQKEIPGWREAASAGDSKGAVWSLVLKARGIPHRMRRLGQITSIYVLPSDIARAEREIALYEKENLDWPPPALPADEKPAGDELLFSVAVMSGLAVFHDLTTKPVFSHLREAGRVSALKIFLYGEWWRSVTALTLHSGFQHLGANALTGAFFLAWLSREAGIGVGFLFLLLAGGLGNLLTVFIEGMPHSSIGLSTAVFGLIGGLCAFAARRRNTISWRRWLAPLGAGAALLSMIGGPGENVDFTAHIAGLLCGFLLGLPLEQVSGKNFYRSRWLQPLAGLAGLALLTGSWALAFLSK